MCLPLLLFGASGNLEMTFVFRDPRGEVWIYFFTGWLRRFRSGWFFAQRRRRKFFNSRWSWSRKLLAGWTAFPGSSLNILTPLEKSVTCRSWMKFSSLLCTWMGSCEQLSYFFSPFLLVASNRYGLQVQEVAWQNCAVEMFFRWFTSAAL